MWGKIEYGTWRNGASIYKDKKGYFIVDWDPKSNKEYKKYLEKWKPGVNDHKLYFNNKTKKWQLTKPK